MQRALVVLLVLVAAGCADVGESRDARLERIEARLDRLDDRLTRAEERLQEPQPAASGGSASAGGSMEGLQAMLGSLTPEQRENLRARFGSVRERVQELRETSDINAPEGSPEYRRARLLELLRKYRNTAIPGAATAPTPAG